MRGGEGVHQAGDGGTFLGHLDEDFARLAGGVEANGDVALMAGDGELVGDGGALLGQPVADGARRTVGVLLVVGGLLRCGVKDSQRRAAWERWRPW